MEASLSDVRPVKLLCYSTWNFSGNHYTPHGYWLGSKSSAVKCQSKPSINLWSTLLTSLLSIYLDFYLANTQSTLNQHLHQHSIDSTTVVRVDRLKRFDRHSLRCLQILVNSWPRRRSSVDWMSSKVLMKNLSIVCWTRVDWVSIKGIDWGCWSTFDCWCFKYTSLSSLIIVLIITALAWCIGTE